MVHQFQCSSLLKRNVLIVGVLILSFILGLTGSAYASDFEGYNHRQLSSKHKVKYGEMKKVKKSSTDHHSHHSSSNSNHKAKSNSSNKSSVVNQSVPTTIDEQINNTKISSSSSKSKSKSSKKSKKSKSSKSKKSKKKSPSDVEHSEFFYSKPGNQSNATFKYDFTLVLQCSMDRSWMVTHICKRWHGPIKLALYKVHHEDPKLSFLPEGRKFSENASAIYNETSSSLLSSRHHHYDLNEAEVKGKCPHVEIAVLFAKSRYAEYPVNKLRNMGINAVSTSHYFLADIDFIPDNNIYESLRSLSFEYESIFDDAHLGLVVPAFRMASVSPDCYTASSSKCAPLYTNSVPKTFGELLECVSLNICRVFDYYSNPEGHTTTDYPRMMRMETPMLFKVNCFNSNKYEPYLVLRKETSPRYDENFEGYGKNKIELIMRLRAMGYSFRVLPQSFLVHIPHPRSLSKRNWKGDKRSENLKLLKGTKNDLKVHSKAVSICKTGGRVQDLYKDHDPWTAAVLASVYTLKNNPGVGNAKYRSYLKKTFNRKPKPPCDNRKLCY